LVLNVRDLEVSHKFWTEIIGFRQVAELKDRPFKMRFYSGVDADGGVTHHDLALAEAPPQNGAPDSWSMQPRRVGLNHVAIAWPDRESWLEQVEFLQKKGVKFLRRVNHGMTHSVYIEDPDGHGIEVLYELPREVWEKDIDGAQNFSERLPTEGPFKGVPYLLKDLGVLYSGTVTSFGSRLYAGYTADHDSEIVARLKRAGLVIAGKTNTPEMGIAPSTEPRLFGPTRNPWKLTHSAGGSSGGAAAAVAAGMLPMAHATDGGGSIRIPASACGLFGLKPTRARNPAGPDAGEGWSGASIGHAVTWSVRDSAALLDATAGPDVGDPYWAPPMARPFLQE